MEGDNAKPGLEDLEVFHAHRWLLDSTQSSKINEWVKTLVKAAASAAPTAGQQPPASGGSASASGSKAIAAKSKKAMDTNKADILKFFAPKKK